MSYITIIVIILIVAIQGHSLLSTAKISSNSLRRTGLRSRSLRLAATDTAPFTYDIEKTFIKDNKLVWKPDGYKTWVWRDMKVNYVDVGGDDSKPPLLLIHGFGASIYHWRYNIPALSEKYHVYALDLLGFGLSGTIQIESEP